MAFRYFRLPSSEERGIELDELFESLKEHSVAHEEKHAVVQRPTIIEYLSSMRLVTSSVHQVHSDMLPSLYAVTARRYGLYMRQEMPFGKTQILKGNADGIFDVVLPDTNRIDKLYLVKIDSDEVQHANGKYITIKHNFEQNQPMRLRSATSASAYFDALTTVVEMPIINHMAHKPLMVWFEDYHGDKITQVPIIELDVIIGK